MSYATSACSTSTRGHAICLLARFCASKKSGGRASVVIEKVITGDASEIAEVLVLLVFSDRLEDRRSLQPSCCTWLRDVPASRCSRQ
ncbi:hypothetical protein DENIT_110006 [Pseudomonas veronii]|nr:hypothetical protein DENIT_110006 [Pseudomonas veronii]CAE6924325.1 protein of unknown function [Pseudomonas oleovorans]